MAADRGTHGLARGSRWQCVPAPLLVRMFGRRRGDDPTPGAIIVAAILVIACLWVLWPGPSRAQERCAEGRTAAGQCVNAALADGARQKAIIFAQPEISQTAFPVLPSGDAKYRYPNELIPDPLRPSATGIPAAN